MELTWQEWPCHRNVLNSWILKTIELTAGYLGCQNHPPKSRLWFLSQLTPSIHFYFPPDTLDVSEIRLWPVEVGSFSHYWPGFIHPRWFSRRDFWTITRINASSAVSTQPTPFTVFCQGLWAPQRWWGVAWWGMWSEKMSEYVYLHCYMFQERSNFSISIYYI